MMGPLFFRSFGATPNAGVEGAVNWLLGQLDPLRRGTGGAEVYADAEYDPGDTALAGGFRVPAGTALAQPAAVAVDTPSPIPAGYSGSVRGHATVPVQDRGPVSPVVLDSPIPIPAGYVGTFRGRLVGAPAGGTYRVDAYTLTSTGYHFQSSTPVDGGGNWSASAGGQTGEWRFRAVNVVTGVQVGGEWQAATNGASRTQYRVDAFLVTNEAYAAQGSAPVLLLNGVAGWTFTAIGRAGAWRFRLVNVDTGAQEGREWSPSDAARYDDLEIRLYGWADAPALLQTAPATGDGRWSFATSDTSPKVVTLTRASTGQELARWATRTGLIRSFAFDAGDPRAGTEAEERTYVYDQALAILAFLATGNTATACRMATALAARQDEDGSFPAHLLQLQTTGWDFFIRTGPIAWAAYALLKAADAGAGVTGCDPAALRASADRALGWIEQQTDERGLVHGGVGSYPDGVIDHAWLQLTFVPGFDTAANAAAWMALRASRDPYRQAMAGRLRDAMLATLWDDAARRFAAGADDDMVRLDRSSLDAHVFGSLALRAWRRGGEALESLSHAEARYRVTEDGRGGFRAYVPAEGVPNADARTWLEGSFAASLALQRAGDDTRDLDADLAAWQEPDGSFRRGALRDGDVEVVDTAKSVASTAWFVLSRFPNLYLWTELDPAAPSEETRVAYRMTVYAPPVDGGPEIDVLRPRAGSPHADPFQVTTEASPPSGWKPYLSLKSNRRGELDPKTFHAEAGEIIVEVLDARLAPQDNVTRWASAFIGDERGRTWLQGLRAVLEVSLNGGSRWDPWFAGRIAVPAAPAASENGPVLRFQVRDHRVEEYRAVFTGCPHPSQWSFCRPSPLLPIGFGAARAAPDVPQLIELDTLPWSKLVTRRPARLYSSSQNPNALLVYLPDVKGPERLRPPTVLFDIAARRAKDASVAPYGEVCPDVLVELRPVQSGGVLGPSQWYLLAPIHYVDTFVTRQPSGRDGYDGEKVSPIFIADTHDRDYKVVCGVGIRPFHPDHVLHHDLPTAVGDDHQWSAVLYNFGPPRKGAPLLLNTVDGVTLYQRMLEGALSDLDSRTMEPAYKPPIPYDAASFDAARAKFTPYDDQGQLVAGGGHMRFMIEQSYDLQRFFEQEIAPVIRHASVVGPDGAVRLMDLSLPSDPTTLPTVTYDDYIAGDWEQGQDTVNSVIGEVDLFGWSEIELSENQRGKDTPYDVPALGVQRQSMGSSAFSDFASHLPLTEQRVHLQGLKPKSADAYGVQKALEPVLQHYLSFFGTGGAYLDMRARRHTLDRPGRFPGGLIQGTWALVETPESPNPAVNRRGGHRVMLLVQREEDGPELRLRWLDAGPDATPVGIGLANARKSTEHPRSDVWVDVSGVEAGFYDAEVQYAAVASGAARPAEADARWTAGGFFTAGTATVARTGGPRVWLRGRRVARVPHRLASDWTYAGPVDLDAVPEVRGLDAQPVNGGDVRLSWFPATVAGLETEVYLARGGVPAEWTPLLREVTAPEGVTEHWLFHLEPATVYAAAARFVDTAGAAGPFTVTLFTTPSNLQLAPRPAGIAVIIGGIA
jgi:hypothetical protein